MAVNLITGETVMGLDPQLIMNLSLQLAAPSENKINQVNFLTSYLKKNHIDINEYLFECFLASLGI